MTDSNVNNFINRALVELLNETFEKSHGIYLDSATGTSIFETLDTISAEEASQPSKGGCATIAAHVEHMTYYIDILLRFIQGERPETDWADIWERVSSVTEEEWTASQTALREAYAQLRQVAKDFVWEDERQVAGAIGMVAHNAYHLGEIRQMLCAIQAEKA